MPGCGCRGLSIGIPKKEVVLPAFHYHLRRKIWIHNTLQNPLSGSGDLYHSVLTQRNVIPYSGCRFYQLTRGIWPKVRAAFSGAPPPPPGSHRLVPCMKISSSPGSRFEPTGCPLKFFPVHLSSSSSPVVGPESQFPPEEGPPVTPVHVPPSFSIPSAQALRASALAQLFF